MNSTEIKFDLEFGTHNGTMQADILVDRDIVHSCNQTQTVSLTITMPNIVKIKLTGKNSQCDTLVGANGEILADKYVKLCNLIVSKVPVNYPILRSNVCQFISDDGSIVFDNYWGSNGEAVIDFNFSDPIAWLLKKRNKFLV
jgi:hypothetical protein